MEITLSQNGYEEKPDISKVSYTHKSLSSIEELESFIKQGYVLSANFNARYAINQKDRTYSNFKSIPYVMIDLDDYADDSLENLVKSLKIKPTVAYSTFSHRVKGNRYRFLYFFSESITSTDEYKQLYGYIKESNNLSLSDNCGNNPTQACIGSKHDCEYIYTGKLLNIEECLSEINDSFNLEKEIFDFNIKIDDIEKDIEELNKNKRNNKSNIDIEDYTLYIDENNIHLSGKINSIQKKKESDIQSTLPIMSDEEQLYNYYNKNFLNDFFNNKMSFEKILRKYQGTYRYIDRTPLPKTDPDIPIITLPENYVEIKRRYYKRPILNERGETKGYEICVVKLKDGQGRRQKIYTATLLRKVMLPGISFPHMLYCALYDLYHYCFNAVDPIGKSDLYRAVDKASKTLPSESLIKRSRIKKEYVANDAYCEKHGVDRIQAIADSKKSNTQAKYEEMLSMYNPEQTYEENVECMNQFGLKVSTKDLQKCLRLYDLKRPPRKKRIVKETSVERKTSEPRTRKKSTEAILPQINQEGLIEIMVLPGTEERLRAAAQEVFAMIKKETATTSLDYPTFPTRLFA